MVIGEELKKKLFEAKVVQSAERLAGDLEGIWKKELCSWAEEDTADCRLMISNGSIKEYPVGKLAEIINEAWELMTKLDEFVFCR